MMAGPARNAGAPKAAAWTTQAERSSAWVLRLMRWIAVALGRPVARAVLHPITLYFLLFGGPATRASRAYLRRVLGREPRWSERYRHIHCFAATILDRVYLLRGDFHRFDVRVTGVEHLEQVLQSGRGAFLVGAHLGSFEALRTLGQARRGLRVAMLMYEHNAKLMNTALRALAPEADLHVIGLGRREAMLELRDWLDGGGVAGLLADRTLQAPGESAGGRSRTHWIAFLGTPAAFSDGAFRLALLLRRPVVAMAGLYHGGNRYELRFAPLADFSAAQPAARPALLDEAVLYYARWLEAQCRETPWNWFNFFDFWAGPGAGPDQPHHVPDELVPPAAPGPADPVARPARAGARRGL